METDQGREGGGGVGWVFGGAQGGGGGGGGQLDSFKVNTCMLQLMQTCLYEQAESFSMVLYGGRKVC